MTTQTTTPTGEQTYAACLSIAQGSTRAADALFFAAEEGDTEALAQIAEQLAATA